MKFKILFRDTLPVLAGYLILGMGFGILMNTGGYGTAQAILMSVFIYAGSMQYAAIGLFAGQASILTVALTTLAVNSRHIFYGISMLDKYSNAGIKKPYMIFSLTDETYSLNVNSDKGTNYYFGVSLLNHIYWITGTAIGAFAANAVSFNTKGIDFALTALFITVFTDQCIKTKDVFPALVGVSCSVISLVAFGKQSFLIPAMIGIAILLLIGNKRGSDNER